MQYSYVVLTQEQRDLVAGNYYYNGVNRGLSPRMLANQTTYAVYNGLTTTDKLAPAYDPAWAVHHSLFDSCPKEMLDPNSPDDFYFPPEEEE